MYERNSHTGNQGAVSTTSAKYLSGGEVDSVIKLLNELRETTMSRSSHAEATRLIVELGGRHRLPECSLVADR